MTRARRLSLVVAAGALASVAPVGAEGSAAPAATAAAAATVAAGATSAGAKTAGAATHRPEDALCETLRAPRFQYCHDPAYALTADEVKWCALLPAPPDPHAERCPAFPKACRAGATAKVIPTQKPIEIKLPDFGGLGRLVFYCLIIGGAGFLIYALARRAVGRQSPTGDDDDDETRAAGGTSEPGGGAPAAVERDVARLLARAQAAAAAGDYLGATSDLYAALLRRLEGDGHIRIHRAATNGDYLRELRSRAADLAAPVRDVASAVESIQFGAAPASAGAGIYQAVATRVTALLAASARVAPALVVAFVLGAGLSCDLSRRLDWRDSPSGSAAVAAYLTAAGIDTRERLRPLADLATTDKVAAEPDSADTKGKRAAAQLMILPDADVTAPDWETLRTVLGKRNLTVIVAGPRALPSWIAVELVPGGASGPIRATPELRHWRRAYDDDAADADAADADAADHDDEDHDGTEDGARAAAAERALAARVPGAAWVNVGNPTEHTVLLQRGRKAYAVKLELPVGRVIVLADAGLTLNAALPVADNAALLRALVSVAGGPVDVVTQETGVTAATPFESVSRGRLAPFLCQLGAFLILLFVLKGALFGRPLDREIVHRRRFAEHVEALGLQYAHARGARHALGAYAAWTVERLRENIHLSGPRALGALAAAVAARTGRPLGGVARLLFEAHRDDDATATATAEQSTRAAAAEDLTTMRELAKLLAESSGGRTTAVHKRRGETTP